MPSARDSRNYTIGYVNGKLTVGPRPLTITAKDANKIYGDPAVLDGASGFTTSTGDLVNGDVVSSVTFDQPRRGGDGDSGRATTSSQARQSAPDC